MITEDYVSFEIAKLLKEKGFDGDAMWFIVEEPKEVKHRLYCHLVNPAIIDYINVPTLQMAMKWLREVHKIGIFPSTYTFTNGDGTEEHHPYGTAIINLVTYELITDDIMPRSSYEQACEAAIKYCLEQLI